MWAIVHRFGTIMRLCYTGVMNTRDILFISLAISALVATGFWVWLLWYIIRTFKSISNLIESFKERLNLIDNILRTIHDKLTSTHTQLSMLAEGVKQAVTFINNRRNKKGAKSSKRASAEEDDL